MKNILKDPARRLTLILNLIAIHSLVVGIALIVHPARLMELSGYAPIREHFFPVQGGVFHVIMAVGYYLGGRDLVKHRCLVLFAIVIKSFATVFLFSYFIFVQSIWMVFISAIGDGMMALAIFVAFRLYDKSLISAAADE